MQTTVQDNADERSVSIAAASVPLDSLLMLPEVAESIVLLAHGGSSSLYSTRDRDVAHVLHQAGLATLLMSFIPPEQGLASRWFKHDLISTTPLTAPHDRADS